MKKPKRIELEISDPYLTLQEWETWIKDLKKMYGAESVLCTDAGANNVSMILYKYGLSSTGRATVSKAEG